MTRGKKGAVAAACLALAAGAVLVVRGRGGEEAAARGRAAERPAVRQLGEHEWAVSRTLRSAVLSRRAEVVAQVDLLPHPGAEPDSVTHLTIARLDPESPLYAAGFRKDDEVLGVNGTPIGTMGRALNLIHEVEASPRLTVQVRRHGSLLTYQFEFD